MPEPRNICCQGGGLCCDDHFTGASPSISHIGRSATAQANARLVTTIPTLPPHGFTGWYQSGTYSEDWNLYETTSSGTSLVATHTTGYDWNYTGGAVISDDDVPAFTETPFDNRITPGPSQFYVFDSSELLSLGGNVTDGDVGAFLLSNLSDWGPLDDIPATGLIGSGLIYTDAGGNALQVMWRADGVILPIYEGPVGGECVSDECFTMRGITYNVYDAIGVDGGEESYDLPWWSIPRIWSSGDPGTEAPFAGGFIELPFERDQQWVAELTEASLSLVMDVAYVCDVTL